MGENISKCTFENIKSQWVGVFRLRKKLFGNLFTVLGCKTVGKSLILHECSSWYSWGLSLALVKALAVFADKRGQNVHKRSSSSLQGK